MEVLGSAATGMDNPIAISQIVAATLFAFSVIYVRGAVFRFALLQFTALLLNGLAVLCATDGGQWLLPVSGAAVTLANLLCAAWACSKIDWTQRVSGIQSASRQVGVPWLIGMLATVAPYCALYLRP